MNEPEMREFCCNTIARQIVRSYYPLRYSNDRKRFEFVFECAERERSLIVRYCPYCGTLLRPLGSPVFMCNALSPICEDIKKRLSRVRTLNDIVRLLGEPDEDVSTSNPNTQTILYSVLKDVCLRATESDGILWIAIYRNSKEYFYFIE